MSILPVIEPLPVVGQPQIEPQLVESRIGLPQMPLPRAAALTLGVKQPLLKIHRRIQQTLCHRAMICSPPYALAACPSAI